VLLLLFLLNLFVKHKIESRLQELDPEISYEELGVNIYLNRYHLEDLQTRQPQFSLSARKLNVKGISYTKLISDGSLEIDEIEVLEPEIVQFKKETGREKQDRDMDVKIGHILLSNGNFSSKESDTSEATIFLSFPELRLKPGAGGIKNFQPESYWVELDSAYVKMNEEHYINVGGVEGENGKIELNDFRISPKYPRADFDRRIPYEKDHINLKIPRISFENFSFQRLQDTLHLTESKMLISEAFLEIYRNKLLPDDTRPKPLYNELLRNAPVKLNFEQVLVENSEIIYEEQVQEDRQAGIIRFTNVEGEINHLNNLRDSLPETQVSAQASFMRGTFVSLKLEIPVFDDFNSFRASGGLGEIEGEALDPFIIPAMDVQLRGKINDISFNFFGNDDVMEGDFVMEYESLEVELLKDEGTEKKGFLSFLANLLVKNEAEAGRQENRIEVERDKQRSFWNFLWLGLRKGFIETVEQF
jgi:hypothetical protein